MKKQLWPVINKCFIQVQVKGVSFGTGRDRASCCRVCVGAFIANIYIRLFPILSPGLYQSPVIPAGSVSNDMQNTRIVLGNGVTLGKNVGIQ